MRNIEIKHCVRHIPCYTCDDPSCILAGRIEADCPKWRCANYKEGNCEKCKFIKDYIKQQYGVDF